MRKFTLSLVALLTCFMGANAVNLEQVYKIDYSTYTGFPFYVMGYVPEWVGGVMTDFGASYKYQLKTEADDAEVDVSEAILVATSNGTQYYRWTTGGGWHQYFIADGIKTVIGSDYKVKALVKASENVSINVNMGWGWGSGESIGTSVTVPQNDDFVEVEWEYKSIGGSSCNLVAQPGTAAATIEWKELTVYKVVPDIVYITEETGYDVPTGATDLNGMTGADSKAWVISYPQVVENETLFGGNIDGDNRSVDISSFDYLHFVVTNVSADAKCGLRVFVSTASANDNSTRVCLYPRPIADYATVTDWTEKYMITTPGVYVVKISDYPLLRGMKALQGWAGNAGTITVAPIYLTASAPVEPVAKVVLAGTDRLADESVTAFDVTGVSSTANTFDAANPNALFVASSASTLTNTKNVIVSGVCANLELTDQMPFKAPADFTATSAKMTKSVSAADYATLVLPFDAALPSGVEAYNCTDVTGNVINTSAASSIAANKPVLLKNEGTYDFTASDVTVKAVEGVQTNGILNGVYEVTDVPTANGYVLQNQSGNVNFFKAVDGVTVKAFRAYLTADAAARLSFDFEETTGITNVAAEAQNNTVYNLAGQRVANAQKGLFIVNGKKMVIK